MLSRLRPRVTYANVVSTLCLFIVLGGGAYAAVTLPKNSVGSKQIKKNAVTSPKVKDGSLTAADVKSGQFALPGDLAKYLPLGGMAANSSALGGIGPGGFVHGAGKRLSGGFDDSASGGELVPVPGGGSIKVSCGSSGYTTFFSRPTGGTRVFDIFRDFSTDGASPSVTFSHLQPNTVELFVLVTADSRATFDVSSDAGYAEVTAFVHYDSTSKHCTARARGFSSP
jgi:hypothetical protein